MGDKKTVFRQDFASIYTAATTGKWFQYFGIELLPWPVFGLDLNLIENLGNSSKKSLRSQEVTYRKYRLT